MSRQLYSLLFMLLASLFWAVMGLRARRAKQSWDIFSAERFGVPVAGSAAVDEAPLIWVHAVSLGETRASRSLVSALMAQGFRILLTHMTATGRAEGRQLYAQEIAAGKLIQAWVPYDFPGATRRFFNGYRPALGILIEREIWPNLVHAGAVKQIPLALVSARFSEKAFKQSQGRWMGPLLRSSLASISTVLCQTQGDAERLAAAGARDPLVLGNLKFDVSVAAATPPDIADIKRSDSRLVVALASTREGEDRLFVDALMAQRAGRSASQGDPGGDASIQNRANAYPGFLTLLIPRHPQRFESAFEIAQSTGLQVYRRSATGWQVPLDADVLLGDSLGEMTHYLGLANVAIICGSFAPLGGQNFIEACALGIPVIVGPHTRNFEPAAQDAIDAGAVLRATSAAHALDLAQALLADPAKRAAMADAGRAWVALHVGATERIIAALPLAAPSFAAPPRAAPPPHSDST